LVGDGCFVAAVGGVYTVFIHTVFVHVVYAVIVNTGAARASIADGFATVS